MMDGGKSEGKQRFETLKSPIYKYLRRFGIIKTIMLTIGGCVAFIAMSEALPLFFK